MKRQGLVVVAGLLVDLYIYKQVSFSRFYIPYNDREVITVGHKESLANPLVIKKLVYVWTGRVVDGLFEYKFDHLEGEKEGKPVMIFYEGGKR